MGLFMNFDKPGPGIRKDAPPQKAVPRFFSILQRKFFDLVKLNLLFCIPVAVAAGLFFLLNLAVPYLAVDLLPVIFLSPFISGLTIVTRNYAREEHSFIFSDFKDAIKNNWVPFIINGALCYAVVLIFSISIPYYWQKGSQNLVFAAGFAICVVIMVLFLFSQFYVPVLIVTFKLKLIQVWRNAFIFAIIGLGRNLLITVLLLILALFFYLSQVMILMMIIAALFVVFLLFSYVSFLINFTVYPLIDKMMIQPYKKQQDGEADSDGEEDDDSDDSSDFSD